MREIATILPARTSEDERVLSIEASGSQDERLHDDDDSSIEEAGNHRPWLSWRLRYSAASISIAVLTCLAASHLRHRAADSVFSDRRKLGPKSLKTWGPAVPTTASQHNGIEWPTMVVKGHEPMHLFAIGDWGGLDGAIVPPIGYDRMDQLKGGKAPGPHVFVKPRNSEICPLADMILCFDSHGGPGCRPECRYVEGVDNLAQLLVAKQMKLRALKSDPKAVLNVGDNFYWGGIPEPCGSSPMNSTSFIAKHMFDTIFDQIYQGPGLDGKPWLSCLGNHDYGGRQYTNSWDAQIAYTWHNDRWLMPAQYWMQRISFPDQDFSMDVYVLDSNMVDAFLPDLTPNHNMCSRAFNLQNTDCSKMGGPRSLDECPGYFSNLWKEQVTWVEQNLKMSKADWQIIMTHYPCGHEAAWYKKLHDELGLDLLITGHYHTQQVFPPGGHLGELACFITGGGGGILSEAPVDGDWSNSYGFFDMVVNKSQLVFESINFRGNSLGNWTIRSRHPSSASPTLASPTHYPATNCYTDHGAELLPADDAVRPYASNANLSQCIAACSREESCEGVQVPVSNKGVCFRRMKVNISNCAHDPGFDFYLLPERPASSRSSTHIHSEKRRHEQTHHHDHGHHPDHDHASRSS
eukprot:TRINITY_DN7005_c0_g1_i1.p1 TRINITY_DN7005_c0_g1~~TRINITY_DN7005_c0_g1_i1.p1  ORF type:complete len:643 (-),score=81.92 TRINITY_DN7005_c0_g1_i1:218-2119(-)